MVSGIPLVLGHLDVGCLCGLPGPKLGVLVLASPRLETATLGNPHVAHPEAPHHHLAKVSQDVGARVIQDTFRSHCSFKSILQK